MANLPAKTENAVSIQSALIEIVKRKDIDPERLEKFLDLQIKMEDRQAQAAFNEALKGFQKDCPIIVHTKELKHGEKLIATYAPYDEIKHVIQPHLDKWGLSYTFSVKAFKDSLFELITIVRHVRGHHTPSSLFFNPLIEQKGMNEAQRRKSAKSYAKREGLEDALGIATAKQDDDANRAVDTPATAEQLKQMNDLVEMKKVDTKGLKKYLGVSDLDNLSGFEVKKAISALKQKEAS